MTKFQKDPPCGIFLKRRLFKDVKNDIPMCQKRKYKNTNTQYRQDQLKLLNSDVRLLNNGPCTQGVCVHARLQTFIYIFFNWHSLYWDRIDEICLNFWIPISGACATAQARWVGVRACTQGGWKVGGGVTAQPKLPCGWFLIIFPFFTLSLGPLEAEIYVFSDGLSENDWKRLKE